MNLIFLVLGFVIIIKASDMLVSGSVNLAKFLKIPYDVLETISKRIVNEVPFINRIVYDITSKPPATIEWE